MDLIDRLNLMFPHGHVIHYGSYINGFQKVKLLCGRNANKWEMKNPKPMNYRGSIIHVCKICIKKI